MKLLTAGQVGRLKKISLAGVIEWANGVKKEFGGPVSMGFGIIADSSDPYGRSLMPIEIVNTFPKVPSRKFIKEVIKKYEENEFTSEDHLAVFLGGNSLKNKDWIEKVQNLSKKNIKSTHIHYYKHWETNDDFIDLDFEIETLSNFLKGKTNYVVFAKSMGVLLTIKAVSRGLIQPNKCLFVGMPLAVVKENKYKLRSWLTKYKVYTLFIQHDKDPLGSADSLKKYLDKNRLVNYAFMELKGDTHSYEEFDILTKQFSDLVHKVQINKKKRDVTYWS